jgi:hypothetical protein
MVAQPLNFKTKKHRSKISEKNIFTFFCFYLVCIYEPLYICSNKKHKDNLKTKEMKNEIIYNNRTIIEGTNGLFTAYYSNYSANLTKDFKTLEAAKKQIDKWLN